jgi:hypothetical protein
MQRVSSTLSLALILALKCAHGQDLRALQACTRLGDDSARLSCFDAAMGASKSASGAAKLQSATQPAAVDTQPQANFGDDGQLHTKTDTLPPKILSARVREASPLPGGLYRLTLDNGQVWNTTRADSALAFKSNDAITITRGWLGSYSISLAGHNTSVGVARRQ